MENISKLEETLNYVFKNKSILNHALVHKSAATTNHLSSNERLEFLGDAVLELCISDYIYKKYPDIPEGKLAKMRASLVCKTTLAIIANKISLGDYIKLGKGEINTEGNKKPSILADALEAVFCAVYLDGGFKKSYSLILNLYKEYVFDSLITEVGDIAVTDYKTNLQEVLHKNKNVNIEYLVTSQTGLPHDKNFYIDVLANGKVIGSGQGKSKKEAEQVAAMNALNLLK